MTDTNSTGFKRRHPGDDTPPKMVKNSPNIPPEGFDYALMEEHPLAGKLPMIKEDKFAELKESIRKYGLEQKLIIYNGNADGTKGQWRLLDGRNRRKALKELGVEITVAMVEVFEGSWADAKAKVFNLNYNRRQLTPADQRKLIKDELEEQGGLVGLDTGRTSARQIAKVIGCSHNTVTKVIEDIRNPKELEKFKAFKLAWNKDLTEDQRKEFVRSIYPDIPDYMSA